MLRKGNLTDKKLNGKVKNNRLGDFKKRGHKEGNQEIFKFDNVTNL